MATLRYGVLAGAQIAVAAAAIFARYALSGAGPLAVSASRLCIAAAVLLLWGALRGARRDGDRPSGAQQWIFVAAGVALAAHFTAWISSLQYTSVAISTLLVATTPVWTALYDAVILKRPLSPLSWFAMVLAGAGAAAIVLYSVTPPPIPGHALLGALLALAGALAIGAYFILVRSVSGTYGTRAIVTRTYSWAALVLIVCAAFARQAPPALDNATAWGGIAAMALISQLLGHTGMNAALRWFSPSAVALTTLLEPVTAALLAFAIFGERLTPAALGGGLLVLIAIAVFLREEERATPPA